MTSRRIAIVDNGHPAGELEAQLAELGYEVVGLGSPAGEATDEVSAAAPDLILMDVDPGAGPQDVEACNELRRRLEIPILVMIPESAEADLDSAGLTEPYSYIVMPFTKRELRSNVELALCKHDAAEAVRELEDRFFATSIDMLCFLDFNGYFKRVNPAWERALGFTRKELTSRPFIEFVHPDDRERTLKQNAIVRGGGQALAFENRYMCKDGSFRWLRWNAAPDSTMRVIYSVARDITESKQIEEEREQLLRELQDAVAEVNTLRTILPLCSYCRKIRDDANYWHTVEAYIQQHTSTQFSHSICPSCMRTEVAPQLEKFEADRDHDQDRDRGTAG